VRKFLRIFLIIVVVLVGLGFLGSWWIKHSMSAAPEVRSRAARWAMLGCVVLSGLALVPLYFFNPVEHGFFPRCLLHSMTGLDCPGCGGLRATHQLLHGDIVAAFKLNPLFIALLPVGAFFAIRHLVSLTTGRVIPQPFRSPRWIWLLAITVIGFGIMRNFPWHSWFGA